MTRLYAWASANAARIIAVLVVVAIVAAFLTVSSCQSTQTAHTETKLATGQASAAIQSGNDAVQTVGNTQAGEQATHATVKEVNDEIDKAPAGDSNAAADRATCRLRSYRHSSKCVALLGPAPQ